MTDETKNMKWGSDRLWNRMAVISGTFALLTCVLLIANYLQTSKADPVNMVVMDNLVERLKSNPEDSALREEIRMLDLLYRKAYFTSQWQIRIGGYLLLGFVALLVLSLQVIEYRKKVDPVIDLESTDDTLFQRQKARRGIVIGGGLILATAIVFAFLSSNNLNKQFSDLSRGQEYSLESDVSSGGIEVNDLSTEFTTAEGDENENAAELVETNESDTLAESNHEVIPEASLAPEAVPSPSPTTSKDNFTSFRGPAGIGIVSKKNIPTDWNGASGKNIIWKTALPLPGQNSPVIWGDKLFFTGANADKQEVYCLNRETGELIWTTPVGKGTKKPVVSGETGYAAPTAVTDGNFVYAIFASGDIAAIDMVGNKTWERNLGLPDNHYGYSSSLMLANGKLIVQYDQRDSQKLMALATNTGKTIWSTNREVKISWASPIVVYTGTRTEIITVAEPYVISYAPATGKELWRMECISGEVGPSLAYANGIVFSVNDYSILAAIKVGDEPTILWESNEYLSDIPSPVATDKYLFLVTTYGVFACYDALTGQKYWEYEVGNNVFASPMLVRNKIYLLDTSGRMHIFKAGKELAVINKPTLGEFSACTPIFTNGRIYLKGVNNIYCIGK
jgi:outer membrane protein assembly factor BamB